MSDSSEKFVSTPTTFSAREFHTAWDELLRYLFYHGQTASPRGLTIKEQLNVTIHVRDAYRNILVNPSRNIGYRAMVAEWLWIAGGFNDLESLAQYNANYRKFSDDGETLYGAYGPRIRLNWGVVRDQLNTDRDTRQAYLPIWGPDTRRNTKDTPCTLGMQFLIRGGQLHLTVGMRSSDAWLGLPNDFYVFSQLQNEMAAALTVPIGSLTLNLGSSHLYETNFNLVEQSFEHESRTIRTPSFSYAIEFLPELYRRFQTMSGTQMSVGGETIWDLYAKILVTPSRVDALALLKKIEKMTDD
jgi:thymidylate synthase